MSRLSAEIAKMPVTTGRHGTAREAPIKSRDCGGASASGPHVPAANESEAPAKLV
jgi:hypothetical protein